MTASVQSWQQSMTAVWFGLSVEMNEPRHIGHSSCVSPLQRHAKRRPQYTLPLDRSSNHATQSAIAAYMLLKVLIRMDGH